MNQHIEENLERKIKKNIYGKAQSVKITFPAGLGSTALKEIESILNNLWFPQKFQSHCQLLKNEIQIDKIHMSAISELLIRCQCISDIKLILLEEKALGKEAFEKQCRSLNWNMFLQKEMSLKIKVNSVASKAFHETGLKEILANILNNHVSEIVSGENTTETTSLNADLYKDTLTLSISLAGDSLYKRGYRGTLSASAPLREDAAACCIQKSIMFAQSKNSNFNMNTILIPFSGTGTFAFEYLQWHYKFVPGLFERIYALQKMPLFRQESFNFLLKKAKENCLFKTKDENNSENLNSENLKIICIDNSSNANTALVENLNIFEKKIHNNDFIFPAEIFEKNAVINENFLKLDIDSFLSHKNYGPIFLPLNPPYGIRIHKKSDPIAFYKSIAIKINELSKILKKENHNLSGFILCPNEETWSSFCNQLKHFDLETYHFTQGGMDIRVCQFYI
ncbi:hypothetical protein [Silvanigrella aquatica]|uniref:Uncharacterized protein n=1 Tax=Silvanigrella aquatica TaxID=1915309 RepID=A0A1L4D2Y7_9BACT|nr:hypothetical protein [Silvanigrella aquatica]APJ04554.1 hypothetical protein AXG55_11815 [Silvanigrella aquatica]